MNTGPVRLLDVGPTALLAEVDSTAEALSLAAFARAARVPATEVVPGALTVLLDGVSDRVRGPRAAGGLEPRGAPEASDGRWSRCPRRTTDPTSTASPSFWGTDRAGRGRAARRARAGLGVLRLRARLRLPHRPARRARRASAGHPADKGAGRVGRARRAVVRRLPDGLARRLAAGRHDRPDPLGPDPRHRRCWRPAPASGSCRHERLLRGCTRRRGTGHRAGRRPRRPRPPRGAARRLPRPAGRALRQPARGQRPRRRAARGEPRRPGGLARQRSLGRGDRRGVRGARRRRATRRTVAPSGCRPERGWPRPGADRGAHLRRGAGGHRRGTGPGLASTDTLAWVGPPRVEAGTELPLGRSPARRSRSTWRRAARRAAARRPGPALDWLAPGSWERLCRRRTSWARRATGSGCASTGRRWSGRGATSWPARGWCSAPCRCRRTGCRWSSWPTTRPTGATRSWRSCARPTWRACAQLRPGDPVRFRRRSQSGVRSRRRPRPARSRSAR